MCIIAIATCTLIKPIILLASQGPDATIGFVPGWTKRLSPHVKEYVPPTIEVSGFESTSYEQGDGCDGEEAES